MTVVLDHVHSQLPLFVYGTLRAGEANHAAMFRGRTKIVIPAVLSGAVLYDGPGFPYAVNADGGRVLGELVHPLPELYNEVLADLDHLEEYVPNAPDSLFVRVARGTRTEDGEPVLAWVYLAGPVEERRLHASGRIITSGDWRRPV
ncbi:gamma-glutamylcyclotransferase [Streptomyces sp. NBC_01537]|uniref:gamma-glutamylcyclotransferase family protein n=1 Tax=Streptomyces sp. NBC_01537 TaxID=2903896 RepID=UPI0038656B86